MEVCRIRAEGDFKNNKLFLNLISKSCISDWFFPSNIIAIQLHYSSQNDYICNQIVEKHGLEEHYLFLRESKATHKINSERNEDVYNPLRSTNTISLKLRTKLWTKRILKQLISSVEEEV